MNSRKGKTIFLSLVFLGELLLAQDIKVADSLLKVYHSSIKLKELEKIDLIYNITRNHTNSDSVLFYSELLIGLTEHHNIYNQFIFKRVLLGQNE